MALRIAEASGRTDVGRQRQTNEDAFLESSPLFGVADGMGGARAGEVASQIAVETLGDGIATSDASDSEARLAEVARTANQRIYALAQDDESRSGMGTTFTAVLVEGSDVVAGHVGDSRLYRLRDGALERLTRDHSLVEELVRRGEIEPDEARDHPQRSIITRALGPEPEVEVETFTCPARAGDIYLLCSDGLTTMISEERVAEVVGGVPSLDQAAQELVDAANEAGGRDNITVVLFRLEEEGGSGSAAGADADTLSGEDTRVGLDAAEVRAAVDRADAERGKPTARRRWAPSGRSVLKVGFALVAIAALLAGGWFASRQVWFVGENDRGLVTLYRGLPYELPLGVSLYSEEYVSAVPVDSIEPPERRAEIVDQELRDRADAVDLVRQLEDDRLAPTSHSRPAGLSGDAS